MPYRHSGCSCGEPRDVRKRGSQRLCGRPNVKRIDGELGERPYEETMMAMAHRRTEAQADRQWRVALGCGTSVTCTRTVLYCLGIQCGFLGRASLC
jgi:hypothetical protein